MRNSVDIPLTCIFNLRLSKARTNKVCFKFKCIGLNNAMSHPQL